SLARTTGWIASTLRYATPIPATELMRVLTASSDAPSDPRGGDTGRAALPRHYAALDTPAGPFLLPGSPDHHTYIAQSGLIGANGTDTQAGRPIFNAEQRQYTLADDQKTLTVDLTFQQDQVNITKRYTFTRGEHLVALEYLIDNNSDSVWSANLYGQIKRDSQEFTKS